MTHDVSRSGHVRLAGMPRNRNSYSTAAVLWLMIALVFLPIAAAHGLLRLGAAGPAREPTKTVLIQ